MRSLRAASLLVAVSLAALAVTGCSSEDGADDASLEIPLVEAGPDGTLYRLDASFEITLPDATTVPVETDADAPSLSVTLSPGIHSIRLQDGWSLSRSQDAGVTYQPVEALLGSNPITMVRLVPNRAVAVGYQFFIRSTTGELSIRFGVTPAPRQLSGGIRFTAATGDYAAYVGQRIDIQIFHDVGEQRLVTEDDGSLARVYSAHFNALEIYNDVPGLLVPVARGFTGGGLDHTIRLRPDGTASFEGLYYNADSTLTFSPSDDASVAAGPDGFPVDGFFLALNSPVEWVTPQGTLTGVLTSLRQLL